MEVALATQEREKYERIWSINAYADNSPGEHCVPVFQDMAKPERRAKILDAGCGSGKGALALEKAGFEVTMCDLTTEGIIPEARHLPFFPAVLWDDLTRGRSWALSRVRYDWVYCCDVLEHIPPTFAMLVITRLLAVAKRGLFLSISLMPDDFGAFAGTPLHQTIQPYPVWLEQLSAVGKVLEARDLLNTGVYLVEPTC